MLDWGWDCCKWKTRCHQNVISTLIAFNIINRILILNNLIIYILHKFILPILQLHLLTESKAKKVNINYKQSLIL